MADYITRQPSERPVIVVGNITISLKVLQEEFHRDVTRFQAILDQLSVTAEDAYRMGFMQQTIKRLAATAAMDMAARAYSLTVPDELLVRAVSRNPAFQDTAGRFDRTLFRHTVAAQGKSEDVYLRDLRQQLLRVQVSDSVINAVTVPATLLERFKQHRYEKRVAEIVILPITEAPVLHSPDYTILEKFYRENTTIFATPEYRTFSAILLTGSTLAPFVSITEEVIQKACDDARLTLRMPEMRTVEHVLLTNHAHVETILRFIRQGWSLVQAARETMHQVTSLRYLNRAEIEKIEPTLAKAVFTAAMDTVKGPIQSAFGWHILRVVDIIPAGVASLGFMRDQIKEELIAEKTRDVVYELSGKIEDAINGGASLEEAAQQVDLPVQVFTSVDRFGLGKDRQTIANLPLIRAFLQKIFKLQTGIISVMTESKNGSFVVRIDATIPSMIPSLQDIQKDVVNQWKITQNRESARQKAEGVAERLRNSILLRDINDNVHTHAADTSSTTSVLQTFVRNDIDSPLSTTFITRLFGLTVGETAVDETAEVFTVGRLQSIIAPSVDESAIVNMKQEMTRQYAEDIFTQFAAAMGREFNLIINQRMLDGP
ncbi:Peptidyl-prolyl cis-trans isomerase PpiD [invertebrate metagenome]|uniref:Periplasmic chaperone PpiD n=1 Tax=invertebrate metagenome TaxID=1711999 RepID=A0A484H4M4_9ZZZZ